MIRLSAERRAEDAQVIHVRPPRGGPGLGRRPESGVWTAKIASPPVHRASRRWFRRHRSRLASLAKRADVGCRASLPSAPGLGRQLAQSAGNARESAQAHATFPRPPSKYCPLCRVRVEVRTRDARTASRRRARARCRGLLLSMCAATSRSRACRKIHHRRSMCTAAAAAAAAARRFLTSRACTMVARTMRSSSSRDCSSPLRSPRSAPPTAWPRAASKPRARERRRELPPNGVLERQKGSLFARASLRAIGRHWPKTPASSSAYRRTACPASSHRAASSRASRGWHRFCIGASSHTISHAWRADSRPRACRPSSNRRALRR